MNNALRTFCKETSNNASNTNKNTCALAIAQWAGVAENVRYLHTASDVRRALRTRFSVRSVKSAIKATTVGAARKEVAALIGERADLIAVCVVVKGHIMLMGEGGETIVDNDPRFNDRRVIKQAHGLYISDKKGLDATTPAAKPERTTVASSGETTTRGKGFSITYPAGYFTGEY